MPPLLSRKARSTASAGRSSEERPTDDELLGRYGQVATQYAEEVVSGKIVAGMWARLACQRHLDNLAASRKKTYPYRFDHQRAAHFCYFMEQLPLVEGNCDPPIVVLQPWQTFVFANVYGWLEKATAFRRFTKAYLSVARKNTKTTSLVAAGFYGMALDGERGAQVYNGANKMDQALLLFQPAQAMMEAKPELFRELGLKIRGAKAILGPNNCRWRPVTRKPGDGGGASTWIQDEYHEADSDKLSRTMIDGMGARQQPLAWKITTCGDNIGGPCYSYELQMQKLLQGSIVLENTFAIMYQPDLVKYTDPFGKKCDPDEWWSDAAILKSNPNWGVSVVERTFRQELHEAQQDLSIQNEFKTKRVNIWCNAAVSYFSLDDWKACEDTSLSVEQFAGLPKVIGLDIASKIDLVSWCELYRKADPDEPQDEEKAHYYAFWHNYQNARQIARKENTHWRKWRDEGWLIETPGDVTDFRRLKVDLEAQINGGHVGELCFDPRESGLLIQGLQEDTGVATYEAIQAPQHLSEPLKWLQALTISRRLHHVGSPLVTWSISNVVASPRGPDLLMPEHAGGKQELKIDPVSALLNAAMRVREVLNLPEPEPFKVEVWS